jgi:hypothetical protein
MAVGANLFASTEWNDTLTHIAHIRQYERLNLIPVAAHMCRYERALNGRSSVHSPSAIEAEADSAERRERWNCSNGRC